MSYILDALKKAEAERDPQARATLAIAEQSRRRNRTLAYVILIALIVNAGALLWLFLPDTAADSDAAVMTEQTPAGSAAAEVAPRVSPQPQPEPQPQPQIEERPTPPPQRTVPAPAVSAPVDTVIGPGRVSDTTAGPASLSSLPADIRYRFPPLDFSTHIYADEADLRAVVVNGVRLEEGDRFEGLRVHEITEEGAVFEFEGRLVAISVLDGWN